MTIVTEIIHILVSGLAAYGQGIGSALSTMAQSIFLQTSGDTTTLSVFGTLICVFAAVSLAVSLSRWVLQFVSSFGKRNR